MAEKKTQEPLTLNHHRSLLLQERSTVPPESKVKLDGRRRLCKAASFKDDDVPHFLRIDNFDSPSPGPVFVGDDRENRPTYTDKPCVEGNGGDSANLEEQSLTFLPVKKPSNVKSQGKHLSSGDDDSETKAPGAKSQPDHFKPSKARIEGRKRICKVGDDQDKTTNDEPNFSGIFNFDSPLPKEDVLISNNGGDGNEIRDILNKLSSKMEILSIEKKRVPKVAKDSSSVLNDGKNRPKKEALSKYAAVMGDYAGQEDSDDDCVVVSNHKDFKEVDKQRRQFKQKGHDEVEIVDNDSVSVGEEEETSFTLSDPKSTYKLPTKIAKMLYPHQRDGLKWLWALHCQGKGGILGDDMGLGKTMQICGFIAGLFNSRLTKRVLIVAPKTLLPHWIKELSVVGLSRKTKEYFGTCVKAREYELQYILQNNGILLTTYDIVRNNTKSLCGDHYFRGGRGEDDITWDYMILDEGHLIKNPSTQRAKSLLEIPSVHRIIISGTPIQNNLKELWALFNFCCPELLGDKNWFKLKYESAILRGNDKSASDRDKRIGSAVATELRARIQPYFLRRLKSEVFGEDDATNVKLSKKNEMIVWLKLTNCQRQLYEAFLNSEIVLSAFDGSPLAALTILKKICDHPLLLTKRAAEDVLEGMDSILNPEDKGVAEKLAMHLSDVSEEIDFVEKTDVSCKISFIISLMNDLIPKGHNVLIFSQTRKMLDLIQESLTLNGYEYLRIDGTTKVADRHSVVNKFQEGGGAPIFLLTSQVGGLGLTLTRADRVIVVDPAWNPSTDNQSVDRAYRIGQEKDVIVYRLMTCGTVEEKIYRKQVYKGGLFKSATEHKEQIRYFSQQDLRELLSLPKQGFDISLTQQHLHEEHDRQHTMNNYMEDHIKFLKNLGIAGVSHHSLLFSKTAPVPDIPEEELVRLKESMVVGGPSSHYSVERNIDGGAHHALNPKDVKLQKKIYSPNPSSQPTESEVKDRINRLSQILKNKAMVSSLPDKGEKLTKQIADLNLELEKIQLEKTSQKKVISLDDDDEDGISRQLERVLNV